MNPNIDHLSRIATSYVPVYNQWVAKLKENGPDKDQTRRFASTTLWNVHQSFAMRSLFADGDLQLAKQQFYTCGMLDVYAMKHYDERILDYGINHLSYALLSDSPSLIKKYAEASHSQYETMINRGASTPLYVLQCLIKEDWTEFERVMPIMKNKTVPRFKMEHDAVFYEALAQRNKPAIEQVLTDLVSPKIHKSRNKLMPVYNEFISHPSIGYTKLAWMKGIEVEINSSLIPRQLLPITPLPVYTTEYDFVNE